MDGPEDQVSTTDIERLRAVVRSKAGKIFNSCDVDDVTSQILIDSLAVSQRTGIPVMRLAHTNAGRSRYYSRPGEKLTRTLATCFDEREDLQARGESDFTEVVAIRDLIDRLPEDLRRALVTVRIIDSTLAEASSILKLPISTLHRKVCLAADIIRTAMAVA